MRTQLRTFFKFGEKCEKPIHQAHVRLDEHELERAKKRMSSVLGETLEGLHPDPLRNTFLRNSSAVGITCSGSGMSASTARTG